MKKNQKKDSHSDNRRDKPEAIFSGVRVHIAVATTADSDALATKIKERGGMVFKTLSSTTTHVVFDKGLEQVLEKAKRQDLQVVSPMWIEQSIIDGVIAPEFNFEVGQSTDNNKTPTKSTTSATPTTSTSTNNNITNNDDDYDDDDLLLSPVFGNKKKTNNNHVIVEDTPVLAKPAALSAAASTLSISETPILSSAASEEFITPFKTNASMDVSMLGGGCSPDVTEMDDSYDVTPFLNLEKLDDMENSMTVDEDYVDSSVAEERVVKIKSPPPKNLEERKKSKEAEEEREKAKAPTPKKPDTRSDKENKKNEENIEVSGAAASPKKKSAIRQVVEDFEKKDEEPKQTKKENQEEKEEEKETPKRKSTPRSGRSAQSGSKVKGKKEVEEERQEKERQEKEEVEKEKEEVRGEEEVKTPRKRGRTPTKTADANKDETKITKIDKTKNANKTDKNEANEEANTGDKEETDKKKGQKEKKPRKTDEDNNEKDKKGAQKEKESKKRGDVEDEGENEEEEDNDGKKKLKRNGSRNTTPERKSSKRSPAKTAKATEQQQEGEDKKAVETKPKKDVEKTTGRSPSKRKKSADTEEKDIEESPTKKQKQEEKNDVTDSTATGKKAEKGRKGKSSPAAKQAEKNDEEESPKKERPTSSQKRSRSSKTGAAGNSESPTKKQKAEEATTPVKAASAKSSPVAAPRSVSRSPRKQAVDKFFLFTKAGTADLEAALNAAHALGGFEVLEDKKDYPKATHVVICGGESFSGRTIKTLYGIAHGLHVVSSRWLIESAKKGEWLSENKFLETKRLPGLTNAMKAAKSETGHKLLNEKVVYLGKNVDSEFKDLVSAFGGKVARNMKEANVVVSDTPPASVPENTAVVNMKWLIDSIANYKVLKLDAKEYAAK